VAGFFVARWLFLNSEDTQPQAVVGKGAWTFLPSFSKPRSPVVALLVKELRLRQGMFLVSIILLLLNLAELAILKYKPDISTKLGLSDNESFWIVWMLMPLIIGSNAIAEERSNRTLGELLCLPARIPVQFIIKLLVTFALGLVLGAVLPYWVDHMFLPTGRNIPSIDVLLTAAAVITTIGFYASSLSGALLGAIGVSIGLCFATLGLWILLNSVASFENFPLRPVLIVLAVTALILGYINFKQVQTNLRLWVRNGITFAEVMVVFGCLWFYVRLVQ
jgi:hypothetical protein